MAARERPYGRAGDLGAGGVDVRVQRFPEAQGRAGPDEGMEHLGLPASMVLPLAILELSCLVIYLIPQTAVLGAILLAGYIGGAISRTGAPEIRSIVNIVLGLVVWLGLYLREPRLKELIPLRSLQEPALAATPRPAVTYRRPQKKCGTCRTGMPPFVVLVRRKKKEITMRFMVIVKANKDSEAGVLPDEKILDRRWASSTRSWSRRA